MKSGIFIGPPKKKIYRSYKMFGNKYFSNVLKEELDTLEGDTFGEFQKKKLFTNVLITRTPLKTNMIRFINNVFMTKGLSKKNTKRSKLRSKI